MREAQMDGTAPAPAPAREIQISIATPSIFPGFKFSPTDEELISYYLRNKMNGFEKSVEVIPELEICRHEPWDLPEKSIIPSENEWFFFSARGRKYPNGSQSRRATELGYWKATGKERNVKSGSMVIGTKRTLVFHLGRAPKGERTEWIMHEYCIDARSQDAPVICRLKRNTEFRLTGGGSNRCAASVSVRQIMENSNHGVSGVGAGEKGGESSMARKASSSYDSHSVEQLDSASESNQKLANAAGAAHAESSSRHKDSDGDYEGGEDEDFYADILKDEIIKLDETSTSATPYNVLKMEKSWVSTSEGESPSQLMHGSGALAPPTPTPTQPCAASRRVVFKDGQGRPLLQATHNNNNNNNSDLYNGDKDKKQEWRCWWLPSSCLLTTVFAGKTVTRQVSAIIAVVALLGVAVFLLPRFLSRCG